MQSGENGQQGSRHLDDEEKDDNRGKNDLIFMFFWINYIDKNWLECIKCYC